MRKLIFFLLQTQLSILIAFGQTPEPPRVEEKPTIESVEISGVDESRIKPDLRERMNELVGMKFDQLAVDEVAFDIQNALSDRISAIRQSPGTKPDQIKLLFEVGRVRLNVDHEPNVNSRYTVEDVELRGVSDALVSSKLHDDMRDLIGKKMDEGRADEIQKLLERELSPVRVVSRRVVRGSDRDHVRVIYDVERAPLFKFLKLGDYTVAHQKQSVSFGVEAEFEKKTNRLAIGFFNDGDQLLERFAGYSLTFENIKTGTDHLGFRVHYFNFHDKWKQATELALKLVPEVPGIYRERRGIEPSVTIALDRRFRVTAGASITELQIQYPAIHFQNANAVTAGVFYVDRWRSTDRTGQRVNASYQVRSATHELDSDFIYTRHLGEVHYSVRSHQNEFVANFTAGAITGQAPLFERFSLGNTSTLRGWNKYDLSPVGGNRVAHGSLEYRFSLLQLYYDTGSVWDQGKTREMSHAIGFGLHSRENEGNFFFTFGVPIRSGRIQPLKPMFMIGGHF